MNKGVIILLITSLLLLIRFVHGEKVLYLHFTICKNDTVTLDRIKILENYEVPIILKGDYRLVIKNFSKVFYNLSFNVMFYFFSEPPKEIECSPVTFSLSTEKISSEEKVEIEVYKLNRLLFSKKISLCDFDPDCRKEETPIVKCLNIRDGLCEEGCSEDPDCKFFERDEISFWIVVFFVILFVIVSLILLIAYRRSAQELIKRKIKNDLFQFYDFNISNI